MAKDAIDRSISGITPRLPFGGGKLGKGTADLSSLHQQSPCGRLLLSAASTPRAGGHAIAPSTAGSFVTAIKNNNNHYVIVCGRRGMGKYGKPTEKL